MINFTKSLLYKFASPTFKNQTTGDFCGVSTLLSEVILTMPS